MAQQNLNFSITAKDLTRGTFKKLNQSLTLVRQSIFNLKVGLTAVAGAAGIGLLVKSSLDSIDTLGKTASKLGVTTDALQKLRYASESAGVETRTVDMAVQRFTRRLSEAANGTGEAKDALKELGLNAQTLSKQPLEMQMTKLADAFNKVEGSGERVRLAFKLFDSEGVAFVNTLQDGGDALNAMFKEADQLGFVLSQSAVKGVEEANDELMKLKSMLGGVVNQVVAALAPALKELVELVRVNLVDAFKEAGSIEDFAKDMALGVIDFVESIAKSIAEFVTGATKAAGGLTMASAAIRSAFDEKGAERMWAYGESLKNIERNLDVGLFERLRQAVKGVSGSVFKTTKNMKDGTSETNTYSIALRKLAKDAANFEKNLEDAAVKGVKSLEDALVDLTMGTATAKDAFKSMARSIIADLVRINIQRNVTAPLAEAMSGFFGSSPQAKAIGGSVRANKPYMVGERGAELFVPNSTGSIVPNNKLGGGVVVNQTINLSAGVSQTVRAEVIGMLPQIQEASKAAVLDARRRGGSFSAAFG